MTRSGSRIVVVVPAFREERHIEGVLRTMPPFVDAIVVVDDGSDDRTGERVMAVTDGRVRLERHAQRRGVGAALATGYRIALTLTDKPTDAIAVMAGDGQMDATDLEAVVRP